ncbi:MAG: carboxypeptidase-like regulatory domain-containing protein [Planctomycetota bacterium]
MQKLALLALGLVAALLALLLLFARAPSSPSVDGSIAEVAALDETALERPPTVDPVSHELADDAAGGPERSELSVAVEESRSTSTRVRGAIHGVVVDEDDRPLRDALVQLTSSEAWSAEHEARPVVRYGSFQLELPSGFEARTDEFGAFRIDYPPPQAETVRLMIAADSHHEVHSTHFTLRRTGGEPPLGAGHRDLGTIRLARAASVFGRATDEDGTPIADVTVRAIGDGSHSVPARTGRDGRYVLPHVPGATDRIHASREGYVTAERQPVGLVLGQDAGPIDLVLPRARSIRGVVVDESGMPIEGARVVGRSAGPASKLARATTETDGTFALYLQSGDSTTLKVSHADYRTWSDDTDFDALVEAGATDLRIVLESADRTRFVVVDRETGVPIERFGFRILPYDPSGMQLIRNPLLQRPPLADRPGGTTEAAAEPGKDRFVVRAKGYPSTAGSVRHDEEDARVQTIRLRRRSTIRGRAIRGGEGVAGIDVTLFHGRLSKGNDGSPRFFPDEHTRQGVWTDATGAFEITGLLRSRYRMTIAPVGSPPVIVDVERAPKRGETLDLGDVELVQGGRIEGVVRLPRGQDPAGIGLRIEHFQSLLWKEGVLTTITGGDGRFSFDGVSPGEHEVLVLGERSGIGRGTAGTVNVEDGATTSVELDLTPHLTVEVQLTVDLGGLPVEGLEVQLVMDAADAAQGGATTPTMALLGTTDASGTVRGEARAMGPCRVQVRGTELGPLEHRSAWIDLAPGDAVEDTLRFDVGSLALDLSDELPLPTRGDLYFELTDRPNTGRGRHSRKIPIVDGAIDTAGLAYAHFEGGQLVLTALPAGPATWRLFAMRTGAKFVWSEQAPGVRSGTTERAFDHSGSTTVEVDWRATLEVP